MSLIFKFNMIYPSSSFSKPITCSPLIAKTVCALVTILPALHTISFHKKLKLSET